jgi:hypothetical protein
MYEEFLPGMRDIARQHGYALAVHGSMERDLDLVAVPWVENVSAPEALVFALAESFRGMIVGRSWRRPNRRLFQIDLPWRGNENRNYIEVSVTPTVAKTVGD